MTQKENQTENNRALFASSFHLAEAAKHLIKVECFIKEARFLMKLASQLADLVEPEVDKISEDRMLEILKEIANTDNTHSEEDK